MKIFDNIFRKKEIKISLVNKNREPKTRFGSRMIFKKLVPAYSGLLTTSPAKVFEKGTISKSNLNCANFAITILQASI